MANTKPGSKGCKPKFIVEYTIPYEHRVMVGINAKSSDAALGLAKQRFADGSGRQCVITKTIMIVTDS